MVSADSKLAALGGEIRRHRKAASLSQESLADAIGMHRNYIGLIERGEADLTTKTLFAVGEALGVCPAVFFNPITDQSAPTYTRRTREKPEE